MRHLLLFLSIFYVLLDCPAIEAAESIEQSISIIIPPSESIPKLNRHDVLLIYKSQKRFWDDGRRIQAVNLPITSPIRIAFSNQVIGQAPEELDDYWRDMYFHGVLPPFVFASEEAVIRFISTTPGSIGYVPGCLVDRRVKVVLRLDGNVSCIH